jgi:centromere/kinetochore protein ZW10
MLVFFVLTHTTVHQSEVVLPATAIYSSLSAASLSSLLATIRRDLMIHYIEPLLQRPSSIKTESCKDDAGLPESRLRLSPSPAGSELLTNRLRNLTIVLEFLSANLFPNIPSSHRDGLRKLLCKPITTALQTHLIIPFIPSSFAALPKFLDLVERSVRFEHGVILGTLENSPSDLPIKEWADGLSGHYERKRRIDVMEDARMIITRQEEVPARTFRAESDVQPEVETVVTRIVQENQTRADEADAETGESGWGFEDEVEPESQLDDDSASKATEDLAEAWGWAEDESTTVDDEAAWNDPWNEPSDSSPTSMPPDLTATRTGDLAPNGQQRQANGQHHRGRSTSNVELPPSTSAKEITRPKDVSHPRSQRDVSRL